MRLGAIAVSVVSSMLVCAQVDKPSPIPSRNKKPAVTEATPPAKNKSTAPSGDAERSAPAGGNVGTACFYKPKADSNGTTPTRRAAQPDLPIGTRVRVTNLANKKESIVTITDHGDLAGRLISVSRDVAEELGFLRAGTAEVRIDVVKD